MKKFVFFASSICNMGGQEQYLNNKVRRLKTDGFEVYLFSYNEGEILLDGLKEFKKYINPILRLEPFLYRNSDVEKYLTWVEEIVNPNGCSILIESTVAPQSEWAELFAAKVGGKHIVIDLQEQHGYSEDLNRFLMFKYERNELFGITDKSISQIFGPQFDDDRARASRIYAECGGAIQEIDHPIVEKYEVRDINLGSVGRLDKPYVMSMVREVVSFAKRYPDKSVGLLLIGGGNVETEKSIRNEVAQAENLSLFITGYLYPIPSKLVKKIDCFLSTAGSAVATMQYGIPTIVYSVSTYEPLGIYDYTVKDITIESSDNHPEIQDMLDDIIFNDYCGTHPALGMREYRRDYGEEYKRQLALFDVSIEKQYYDVLQKFSPGRKEKIYQVIARIAGAAQFEKIQRKLGSLKNGAKT